MFIKYRYISLAISLLFILSCSSSGKSKKPDESEIHYRLGISYFNEGNRSGALNELLQALKISPRNKRVHNALGLVYMDLEEYEKGIEHLKKATKIDGEFSEAYNNLGAAYLQIGDYDSAIKAFEIAASNVLYATPERAHNNIGWAYYKKGNYTKALLSYNKALRLSPNFPIPHYNIGLIHYDKGEYEDAAYEFGRIIKNYPTFDDARLKRVSALLKLNKKSSAIEELEYIINKSDNEKFKREAKKILRGIR